MIIPVISIGFRFRRQSWTAWWESRRKRLKHFETPNMADALLMASPPTHEPLDAQPFAFGALANRPKPCPRLFLAVNIYFCGPPAARSPISRAKDAFSS
jgi:hypothetical protein